MKRLIIESTDIMKLCGDCRIGVMTISDNSIYYVDKFCNDCFKQCKARARKIVKERGIPIVPSIISLVEELDIY